MQNTQVPAWRYYFDPRIILPGFSDQIAYEYGVLDQNYSLEIIREASYIQGDEFSDSDADFYNKIRDNYFNKLASSATLE
jgi:hypothetical protein